MLCRLDFDEHRWPPCQRTQLDRSVHCGHLDPPLCEHVENVNVERAVQLVCRAFSGGAAQSLEDSRNGRFVLALFEQRPLDVIAADLDRRVQPDLLKPGSRSNARLRSRRRPEEAPARSLLRWERATQRIGFQTTRRSLGGRRRRIRPAADRRAADRPAAADRRAAGRRSDRRAEALCARRRCRLLRRATLPAGRVAAADASRVRRTTARAKRPRRR